MLIRHSALYVVAKIVPGVLGMVTTAVLTRVLAPGDYGLYSLALLVMSFGASLVFDWLGLAYLRVAQSAADKQRATGTFVRMFLALLGGTAVVALGALLCGVVDPAKAGILGAGLLMAWAYSWFELVSRFHIADLRPGIYLRMNLGRAGLTLVAAGGTAVLTRDPVTTAYASAGAMVLGAAIGGIGRVGRGGFDRRLARATLVFGLPLAASMVLTSVAGSVTRLLVDTLGSIEALGLYTAAMILVQNTLAVAAAGVAAAGFSLAVRAVDSGDAAAARRQLDANGALLLAVLAPAAVGMALSAPSIAATLVGPRYVATVAALTPWMAAGALFSGFRAHYLDHAFQLGRRPQAQIWVTAGCAAVTIACAVLLIPRLGPLGAAIAVCIGGISSSVHAVRAGRTAYRLKLPLQAGWRIAVACAVMGGGVLLVPGLGAGALVMKVGVGGVCYCASAIGLDLLGLRGPVLARLGRKRQIA